jgi:hypothetical protein
MKHVWKMQVTYCRYSSQESVLTIHVVAEKIEDALERAYVAAYKENRWLRKYMNAKCVERLDLKVYV